MSDAEIIAMFDASDTDSINEIISTEEDSETEDEQPSYDYKQNTGHSSIELNDESDINEIVTEFST